MRTLRFIVLLLACYLAGTFTADRLLPLVLESLPAVSAGDVAHLGDAHMFQQSSRTGSSEAASEL